MSVKHDDDAGPAAKGDAEGGSAATTPANSPDVSKLVSEAVKRAVAEATGQLAEDFENKLKAQAENHANQVRRLKKQAGGEGGDEGKSNASAELAAELEAEREYKAKLEKRIADMEIRDRNSRIDTRLNDELSKVPGLVEGATPLIRQALRANLDLNSQGEVIYRDGTKHVSLADKLAELSSQPFLQAPANRGGAGGSNQGRNSPPSMDGKKVIYDDDEAAFDANLEAIAKGEVKVIPRQEQ